MRFSHLLNRRLTAVFLLSFSSGLPLLLTGSTLQAWYTVSGVSLATIGALTLVGWPYLLKFLWSPLLDRFMPFKLGRRRSWVVLMQLCLAISLVFMGCLNPSHDAVLLAMVALLVAFFSATQDSAIDAYRTDILNIEERGLGAAYTSFGYRLAMVLTGAVALVLADKIGWRVTYFIMAAVMLLEIIISIWAPAPHGELPPVKSLRVAVVEPFHEFFTRKNIKTALLILVFILIYKLCDAFALALNTPFLLRGVGFSLVAVGTVAKFVGIGASLLGSFVGGILFPRLGMYRSLMYFGFLQMASNLTYVWLAVVGKVYWVMAAAVFTEFFCSGLSVVAFVAFLMSLCNKKYTATQYALLSVLSAVGRVLIGPVAAVVVDHWGWMDLFIISFLSGIPALILLSVLRRRLNLEEGFVALGEAV